jgi:hypothetical protein
MAQSLQVGTTRGPFYAGGESMNECGLSRVTTFENGCASDRAMETEEFNREKPNTGAKNKRRRREIFVETNYTIKKPRQGGIFRWHLTANEK